MSIGIKIKIVLLLIVCSCSLPDDLTAFEVKTQTLKLLGLKKDTAAIGYLESAQDSQHWKISFNKIQSKPQVFIFNASREIGFSHKITVKKKKNARIEKIQLMDLNGDEAAEMLVWLHFDYGSSYQAKELAVYQYPFEAKNVKKVFSAYYEEIKEQSRDFDQQYGMPVNKRIVKHKAAIALGKNKITLKGIINSEKGRIAVYEWNKYKDLFELKMEEDVSDLEPEPYQLEESSEKRKRNLQVSENGNCSTYELYDLKGRKIKTPEYLTKALECSDFAELSPDVSYLVYADRQSDRLFLFDFKTSKSTILLDSLSHRNGFSAPVWHYRDNHQFFAFAAVDLDDFPKDSRIYTGVTDGAKIRMLKNYDLKIHFSCDDNAFCAPDKTDLHFAKSGNLIYRISVAGNGSSDFGSLSLAY